MTREERWLDTGHTWLLAMAEALPVEELGPLWGRWMEVKARYEATVHPPNRRMWSDPCWMLPVARRNAIIEAANAALDAHFAPIEAGKGGYYPADPATGELLNLK